MRHITIGIAASLVLGCASSEDAKVPTEVAVVVKGDQTVIDRLARVRASVHTIDALSTWKPLEQTEFVLAKKTPPAKGEVTVPISFGILQSKVDRFELVVEGFTSLDASATPAIERKMLVSFQPEKRVLVEVMLAEACYDLVKPCSDLTTTCRAESRTCGSVPESTYVDPTRETSPMDRPTEAGDAGIAACPPDHGCQADYPCVVTGPASYTCLGQMADWPMPIAGSKVPHQYDLTDPAVVVDEVTGLVWQRELPATYPGCTLANRTAGDWCTWDEAKNYCANLNLAGRKWRLPTKIELESLIDTSEPQHALVEPAFAPPRVNAFWTSSIADHFEFPGGVRKVQAWNVSFFFGNPGYTDPLTPGGARCVSNGVFKVRGTPKDRYQVDPQAETVTDRRTGLTWSRKPSPAELPTLADAQRYCTSLGADFRVPSMKEMLTLVDPTLPSPSIQSVFEPPPPAFAWAQVARLDGGVDEWILDLYGSAYSGDLLERTGLRSRLTRLYARCVR